jgi:hypothetical protein
MGGSRSVVVLGDSEYYRRLKFIIDENLLEKRKFV